MLPFTDTLFYLILGLSILSSLYKKAPTNWHFGLITLTLTYGFWLEKLSVIGLVIAVVFGTTIYIMENVKNGFTKYAIWALVVTLSLALSMHLLPGFNNLAIIQNVKISSNGIPYSLWLNTDKALIAIFGLMLIEGHSRQVYSLNKIILLIFTCVTSVTAISYISGLVVFDPKIPEWTALWLYKMIFMTVLPEQVIFRKLIQDKMSIFFNNERASWIISAILFASIHLSAGIVFTGVALIAGLFYGFIYMKTKNILAAAACHLGVNLIHFTLFTYPMLAT